MLDSPPDFVNEDGVKWWKDSRTNEYARNKGIDLHCFAVETPDKCRTYLLLDNEKYIIHDSSSLESVLIKIDVLAYLNRNKE